MNSITANKPQRFVLYVFLITIAGAILRFINITYSSLWADELYSMLSVHPTNSWYEILYMQRTYQPPAYFMLLWGWTKVFGYTEFSARLLSVLGGILAIVLSALLGKKIKDERLGLILAVFVAFNPTQIIYSLEARFYIFTFCIACCSLWLHWHLLTKKPKNFFLYFILAGINAGVVYFHQFGMFFVFGLFVHDVLVYRNDKDRSYFLTKFFGYVLAALFYAPWFFWGLVKGLAVREFWLKEIDVWQYFTFSMGYTLVVNLVLSGLIVYFLFRVIKKENKYYSLFPVLAATVILLPLLYSYVRVPILVDRYGMVMAPAIYLMIGLALHSLFDTLKQKTTRIIMPVLLLIALSVPGIYLSLINKEKLMKQPWREMANWLKSQTDYEDVNVYSHGHALKNRFTIDFYLQPSKDAKHYRDLKIGEDKKMYLVETSSVWVIDKALLEEVKKQYDVQIIAFSKGYVDFGNIYVCKRKNQNSPSL